jgi:hypothetical protein
MPEEKKFESRLQAAKAHIESGQLKTFQQIFQIAGKTAIQKSLGVNFNTFNRKVNDPRLFTIAELIELASLLQIDSNLLYQQIIKDLQ